MMAMERPGAMVQAGLGGGISDGSGQWQWLSGPMLCVSPSALKNDNEFYISAQVKSAARRFLPFFVAFTKQNWRESEVRWRIGALL